MNSQQSRKKSIWQNLFENNKILLDSFKDDPNQVFEIKQQKFKPFEFLIFTHKLLSIEHIF